MDSTVERMLERARARKKLLEDNFSVTGEVPKTPLQETNALFKKTEVEMTYEKSEVNASEMLKMKRKEVVSDSSINTKAYSQSPKENLSDSNLTLHRQGRTKFSSNVQGSPDSPTKTLNIQKENFNMEIKLTSTDKVRVEVEIEERSDDEDTPKPSIEDSGDKAVIREDAKNRLQRLGKLYAGDGENISSPIHRTEAKFYEELSKNEPERETRPTGGSCSGRLAALANAINQWEDDSASLNTLAKETEEKVSVRRSTKYPAPRPPIHSVRNSKTEKSDTDLKKNDTPKKSQALKAPISDSNISRAQVEPNNTKKPSSTEKIKDAKSLKWDEEVLASLESQGFTRTNSNARLVYKYDHSQANEDESSDNDSTKKEEPQETKTETSKVADIASKLQQKVSPTKEIAKTVSVSKIVKDQENKNPKPVTKIGRSSPSKVNLRGNGDVLNKAAMFESSPNKSTKDPALMSVSERKALFEKNKGTALIPKAPFAMSVPVNSEKDVKKFIAVKPASPIKSVPSHRNVSPKSSPRSPGKLVAESGGIASKLKELMEQRTTISQSQIANSIQEQRQKEMDMLLNRFNRNKGVVQEEFESEESDDDNNATELTKMISKKAAQIVPSQGENKEVPQPPPPPGGSAQVASVAPKRRSKGDSPKVKAVLDDVKRIRVSPPKTGRMYPCLSDIEAATETEHEHTTASPSPNTSTDENSESDAAETSFGREILQAVCKNQSPHKRAIYDESTASDVSSMLDEMDDYLDEILAEDSDNTTGPTPPKQGRGSTSPKKIGAAPSHSFNYKSGSPNRVTFKDTPKNNKTPKKITETSEKNDTPKNTPRKSSELPTHVVEGDSVLPLTHTVSFYRRQQTQASRTPVKQIVRQSAVLEESPEEQNVNSSESEEVQRKIQHLLDEVDKQQTVISQASQALNLCCSTIEFSGSCEQVEAERLLLVASHRRQAALHEVQRLKVEGTLHPGRGEPVGQGTLTISDISIPLKKEYIRALNAEIVAGGQGHHVVCLVKCGERVIPTQLVSTIANSPEKVLRIPGYVRLENVYADLMVTLEIYCLQAQEELLPHEVKYHIATKKGGKLTPKKLLKSDSKLIMPSVQSPAGPQAVRSSSFSLMGFMVFNVQAANRNHWTLNKVPSISPLESIVHMQVNCEMAVSVEHRGFLTMFEDVSGFGAWHRRWCVLKGHVLSYWKYPDDEKKRAPIDTLNLQKCTTKQVGPVSREICARPNTFLIESVRLAQPNDTNSLITVCQGDRTIIRYLLSADTKEERIEWCLKFNKALMALRLFGKPE